jgi:hypothetical protein
MAKVTTIKAINTLNSVKEYMATGYKPSEIVRKITKEYSIKDRQAWIYISRAKKQWLEEFEKDKKYNAVEAVETKKLLFKHAYNDGDIKTANTVHTDMAKIQGLFNDKVSIENVQAPLNIQINIAPNTPNKDN